MNIDNVDVLYLEDENVYRPVLKNNRNYVFSQKNFFLVLYGTLFVIFLSFISGTKVRLLPKMQSKHISTAGEYQTSTTSQLVDV